MPENKDFSLRTEIIDECLRNGLRKWTLDILIEEVNKKLFDRYGKTAAKRTIQNDIRFLIEEKGAPIERRKEGNATYFSYSDKNFSIKNLPIQEEEIARLKTAIEILSQVNDFKILQDVGEIVNKLQNTVSTNIAGAPSAIQFEKHTVSLGTDYIDDLFTAIREKIPLRVSYQSFKADTPDQFIFHPYLLKEYRNRWFIIGRRESNTSVTNLALDRIKALKNSSADFIPNNLINPETYFNNLIGVTIPNGEQVQSIEIKVNKSQAPYIRTKPLHFTQEVIKEYSNGDIKVRVLLISNYELRSVLLSFGSDVEILKPLALRESMKSIFQEAFMKYQ